MGWKILVASLLTLLVGCSEGRKVVNQEWLCEQDWCHCGEDSVRRKTIHCIFPTGSDIERITGRLNLFILFT